MKRDVIARRIREAREECGLSQQKLAKLMGWKSHASIVAIEKGEQEVKTWELLKFAQILKISPEMLYSEKPIKAAEPIVVFWRQKPQNPEIAAQEERNVFQHCQDYRLIERLIGEHTFHVRKFPSKECDIEFVDINWANQLADIMYREMGLGDYPAESLANHLEEEYGVLIISRPLEKGSAACYRGEMGEAIILNEKEVPWRQMFNLAHELFHLITWNDSLIEKVRANEMLFNKNEKLADAFAAALLMPQQMIDIDMQGQKMSYSLIVALARKYRVSTQAMLWRLCYLRYLSPKVVKEILEDDDFLQLDRATFKKAFQSARVFGNRFLRLAYLAFERGRLSKARLAQMLGIKLRDVDSYLLEKGFYLTHDKEIEAGTC